MNKKETRRKVIQALRVSPALFMMLGLFTEALASTFDSWWRGVALGVGMIIYLFAYYKYNNQMDKVI